MTRFENILLRIKTYKNWPFLVFPLNKFGNTTFKTRRGPILKGDIFEGDFAVVNEMFARDDYQLNKIHLRTNPVIFDVGANIGAFTLLASTLFRDANFYAFEPSRYVIDQLKNNFALNRLSVNLYPWALASKDSLGDFYVSKQNYGHSLHKETMGDDYTGKIDKVICKTLPSIMKELNVDHIDLLKLDIEGEEYDVLLDLQPETYKKIENVVLEIHNSPRRDELLLCLSRYFNVKQSPTHERVYWCSQK